MLMDMFIPPKGEGEPLAGRLSFRPKTRAKWRKCMSS